PSTAASCLRPTAPAAPAPLPLHDALPIWLGIRSASNSSSKNRSPFARAYARASSLAVAIGGSLRPPPHGGGSSLALPRSQRPEEDRKSTRLNSSHVKISYAVFCWKKKKTR